MAGKDAKAYHSFQDVTERLDQIVSDVRSRNTSLERSLELFDEAIGLGSRAVELVDRTDFSPEEKERMASLGTQRAEEAQEREGGELAQDLLAEQGQTAVAEGAAMGVPGHPCGEDAAQEALERAATDADDGAWSPTPRADQEQ